MVLVRRDQEVGEVYFYQATGRVLTGHCYLSIRESTCNLYDVKVFPVYRGLGEGKRMIQAVVREALDSPHLTTIYLSAHERNYRARHIYQLSGFIQDPVDTLDMFLDLETMRKTQ